jgi:hypothetical protein
VVHKLQPRLRTLNLSGDSQPSERAARNQIRFLASLQAQGSLVQDAHKAKPEASTRIERKLGRLGYGRIAKTGRWFDPRNQIAFPKFHDEQRRRWWWALGTDKREATSAVFVRRGAWRSPFANALNVVAAMRQPKIHLVTLISTRMTVSFSWIF